MSLKKPAWLSPSLVYTSVSTELGSCPFNCLQELLSSSACAENSSSSSTSEILFCKPLSSWETEALQSFFSMVDGIVLWHLKREESLPRLIWEL